jgi:hypothetical protein
MKSIAWIYCIDGNYNPDSLYIVPDTDENKEIIDSIRAVSGMEVNVEDYSDEQMDVLNALEEKLNSSEKFNASFGKFKDANISEIHLTIWAM